MSLPIERLEDRPDFQGYMAKMAIWDAGLLTITGLDDESLLEDDGALLDAVADHLRKADDPDGQRYQLMTMVAMERGQIESFSEAYDTWPAGTLNDDCIFGFVADYLSNADDPTGARRLVRQHLAEETGYEIENRTFSGT
jgi:hypothetical protein